MSYPSLAPFIMKRPRLMRWFKPLSNWYFENAGYRKLGLRADDLLPEETEIMQLALKRLPPKEAYDRVFRMRRAFQCSIAHQLLPESEWTKAHEVQSDVGRLTQRKDYPYLSKIVKDIEAERTEREDLEALVIQKKKATEKTPTRH